MACLPVIRSWLSGKFGLFSSTNSKSGNITNSSDQYASGRTPRERRTHHSLSLFTDSEVMDSDHENWIEFGDKIMSFTNTKTGTASTHTRDDASDASLDDRIYVRKSMVMRTSPKMA